MKSKLLQLGLGIAAMLFSTRVWAQTPVSEFTLSQNVICEGGAVQILDQSSDTPDAWLYTIDANTFTTQNVTYTFSTAGVYTITLVASNGAGMGSLYTETVQVNPAPVLSVSGSSAVCAGDQATLSAAGATSYTWTGGISNGVGFVPTSTSVYSVNATDANGCESELAYTLTVNSLPTLAISGATAICEGSSFTQTVSGADTYTWTGGSNATVFTDTPMATSVYTVIGNDNLTGCMNQSSFTITVNNLPTVSVNGGTICAGDAYTINPSGASTYTISGGNLVVSPLSTSNYTISGTDANGCVSLDEVITLQVNALPVLSVNGGIICSGDSFTLSPSGAVTYTATSGALVVSPVSTTSYSITGTDAFGCESQAAVATITVNALPVVVVNSGSICAGQSFVINPTGAISYTISGGSNTVSPAATSSYSVLGTSADGCVSSVAVISTVTVNALPVISVNSGSVCAGQSFTLNPNGASTYTYSSGTAIVAPTSNTTYSITGTSAQGCLSAAAAISTVAVNALPIISVNSGTICAGQVFTFNVSGASTYTYSNGSNTVSPITSASYSITGTDANGCVSANTAISNIVVNALPVITVNSGAVCAGQTFTFLPGGANTYTFSNGSNTVTPTTNSTYSITGTDVNGCVSATAAISSVTVNALPVITANSGAVCAGQVFTIVASGASTYTYSNGSQTVIPTASTVYSVSGTSANGCVSNLSALSSVTVNALPVINVNSGAICAGQSFTLIPNGAFTYTISGGNNVVSPLQTTTYSITGSDANGCVSANAAVSTLSVNALPIIGVNSGAICAGNTFTIVPTGASTYSVNGGTFQVTPVITSTYSVVGTDANGCVSAAPAVSTVTVNALPVISISSTGSAVCSGSAVQYTASGAISYTWNNGATTSVISVTPTSNSTFTVSGTDANACQNTANVSVSVNSLPSLSISSTASVVCKEENVVLTVSGANSYSWNTGATTPVVTLTLQSTTNFTVMGTDNNGCTTTSAFSQSVSECTGIVSKANNTLEALIFPNPSNGNLTIELMHDATVNILSTDGRLVYSANLVAGNTNLDLNHLPVGMYIVRVSEVNASKTLKLMITK